MKSISFFRSWRSLASGFFLLILTGLTGCASVSVSNINPTGTPPKKLPKKIYVQEFVAPTQNFRVDRNPAALAIFLKNERHTFALLLVKQLTKYIAPAEILPDGTHPPRGNYWLVHGVYNRVNQGSRLLRAAVGFGAGGTKMETQVQFSDLSHRSPAIFLSLLTTGGSGISPGAWAAFTPAFAFYWPSAVANAGGASLSGISVDRNRTTREITATLSEYCFQQGLIPERRMREPKKLGHFPAFQRPDFIVPKTGP